MSDNITITFTKAEIDNFVSILKYASDQISNNGCNDFPMSNTDGNWEIVEKYHKWNGDHEDDMPRRPTDPQKEIYFYDWIMLSYLRAKLQGKIK